MAHRNVSVIVDPPPETPWWSMASDNRRGAAPRRLAAIALLAVTVLVLHCCYYLPFISDDALISLRYAARLLDGRGLTWTDGPRVEGYSNLLWILLAALLGALGLDLIVAVWVLGIVCMAIVILAATFWYSRSCRTEKHVSLLPLIVGLMFFCLSGPIAAWAVGGLEQPLCAALLGLAIPWLYQAVDSSAPDLRPVAAASVCLGLLCLTRPDSPLFVAGAAAALFANRLLLRRPISWKQLAVVVSVPVACYLGQLVFRVVYYHDWVPNTARAKMMPSWHHFLGGLVYDAKGFVTLAPLSLVAVVALVAMLFSPSRRGRGIVLALMLAPWLLYLAFIGGDIFPAVRHFVPVIVILMYALIDGTQFVIERWELQSRISVKRAFVRGGAVAFLMFIVVQFTIRPNRTAKTERYEWKGKEIGLLLKRAFDDEQPTIAVTAAGAVPYWFELPALDMLGLNDHYLARHPPANAGQGDLAHELGEVNYVIERRPDIICFYIGFHAAGDRVYLSMTDNPEFLDAYREVRVQVDGPKPYNAVLWFRVESTKTGIRQSPAECIVPGYLFATSDDTYTHLADDGSLVATITSGQPASLTFHSSLPLEDWQVTFESSPAGGATAHVKRDGELVTIEIEAKTPNVELREVVLKDPHSRYN